MMTLHDLTASHARESIRTAQVISFVNPHTGASHIVVGHALVAAGNPETQVSHVTLSVESEGHELELATAAVPAALHLPEVVGDAIHPHRHGGIQVL
jgi:hypothetical protein